MDIDTPSSPPPGPQTSPSRPPISPATPLRQQAAPPSSPDLLNSKHAPSVQPALPFKFKGAKRTSCQIGSHNLTSQPLRMRPTPNMDTVNKLEEARSLLKEIYHTQGIDKSETGLALTAIHNIRRQCGYPHLGSSRDPWNSTTLQHQPTTTAIQSELNFLRQDLDQKFTTLANLLTSNSNHIGPTYAAALTQNSTTTQQSSPPSSNNNTTNNKMRQTTQGKAAQASTTPSFQDRRLILQPNSEINVSTLRPIEYSNSFHQLLRKANVEQRVEVAAMALSRSGNIIVTAKDGCTADDLIACRDK